MEATFDPAALGEVALTIWKPQVCLPWRARRKGNKDYIWYLIEDCQGFEVCSFGAVGTGEEHDEMFRQIVWMLVSVNGTRKIQVNDSFYTVNWGAERIKTDILR